MPSRARSRAAGSVRPTAPRSPSASGSFAAIAAAARRSTLNVPMRFTRTTVSKGWRAAAPSLPTVRSAQPIPAQDTANRSSSALSTAARTCASSVTSALEKLPPISCASAAPRSSFTSAIVTRAPRAASSRDVASPRPDAPPATKAPLPLSSKLLADPLHQERDPHERAPLVQVLSAEPRGDHIDRLDVAQRLAGIVERGLDGAVRALGRASDHLDDLGYGHGAPLFGVVRSLSRHVASEPWRPAPRSTVATSTS